MTTGRLILLDHAVTVLSVVSWIATGVATALRRRRLGANLLLGAVAVSMARVGTVAVLWGRGWWFVQEKVLLNLPLLGVTGLAAVLVTGPRLRSATGRAGTVVALLTAGYAALAGLVVTFVAGYPLTWSTALIAGSVVGAGALLTWRVLGTPGHGGPVGPAALSRRRFLQAAAVGTGITGVALLFRRPEATVTGGGPGRTGVAAVSVADLRGPGAPAPGGIVRRHTITAQAATVRLASGRVVDALTFDARLPGPAITASEGDLIEVTLRNTDVEEGVTLHWHGYDVPCGEDGVPGATQHAVAPGGEFRYRFRASQVGTYWYHTHQASHPAVRKGLYGTLVVTPRKAQPMELDLTLPVHTFDHGVVIGDREDRAVHTVRPGTPVRLRTVNTDSVPHRFAVAGAPFRVAAVDGRDLHAPGELRDTLLRLPAGGRYDVVLTMPATPVALVLGDDHEKGVTLRPAGGSGDDPAPDTSGWPELDLLHYGDPAAVPFDAADADRDFTIVLDRALALVDGRPSYAQTVDGLGHPSVPDQLVAEGDVVRFTVVNRSLETHPWHLHGHAVLLVSRNGERATGSPVWVDTFDVRPGEVWQVAFQARNPGIWMNHCHNLPHQQQGMMLRLVYDGVSTPFEHRHAGPSAR
ncbi:multicopper oxidase domain-containing protein [Actinoplanes sp. NPDC049548]|uniref:multicopper oxidase domain-containing protein n=1 Tax=Actinoplanes sp. NPDC049548 TaxID=3155152 RepID=UPI0034387351